MQGLFQRDASALQRLVAEAEAWVGTPFLPNTLMRGRGADCFALAAHLMFAGAGLATPELPAHHCRESNAQAVAALVGQMAEYFTIESPEPALPGDWLLACLPSGQYQCAVLLPGERVIQARLGQGVEIRPWAGNPFARHFRKHYRLMEVRS